jgi:iron-sulfur cluster assembly accessory protein
MSDIKFISDKNKTIELSDMAATKLKEAMGDKKAIRLIIGAGCCGPAYQMGIDKKKQKDDKEITSGGIKFRLDPLTYLNLNDLKIEYLKTKEAEGFKVTSGFEGNCGSSCSC